MATVNKRAGLVQATTIDGVAVGGLMSVNLQKGYDELMQTQPDGIGIPLYDRLTEYCRGSLAGQDWVHVIDLLTGSSGSLVCYEQESGVATFLKHTVINPVIHSISLAFAHRGYARVTAQFECKAADENKGFADMHTKLAGQTAPAYVSAARGLEILTCQHGSTDIFHNVGLNFNLAMPLHKASQDGDIGYTAVDRLLNGMTVTGSLDIQDTSVVDTLLAAGKADLVLTIKQSQGEADKTLTISNVLFTAASPNMNANEPYRTTTLEFVIANDMDTPLVLEGTGTKIISVV